MKSRNYFCSAALLFFAANSGQAIEPGTPSSSQVSFDDVQWAGDRVGSKVQIDTRRSTSDSDLDGVNDDLDNCTLAANPDQTDTDADGIGNACDGDFNNDCAVNFLDLGQMKVGFFGTDPLFDMSGDGAVNFIDLGVLKSAFFAEPGPSPFSTCGLCEPPPALGSNDDFAGQEMFIRGGLVEDWAATPGINNFSDQTGGLYVARFEIAAGGEYEYKVADESWSFEYCSTTFLVENVDTALPLLGCAFPANGVIGIPEAGCYEFALETDGNIPPNEVSVRFTRTN